MVDGSSIDSSDFDESMSPRKLKNMSLQVSMMEDTTETNEAEYGDTDLQVPACDNGTSDLALQISVATDVDTSELVNTHTTRHQESLQDAQQEFRSAK